MPTTPDCNDSQTSKIPSLLFALLCRMSRTAQSVYVLFIPPPDGHPQRRHTRLNWSPASPRTETNKKTCQQKSSNKKEIEENTAWKKQAPKKNKGKKIEMERKETKQKRKKYIKSVRKVLKTIWSVSGCSPFSLVVRALIPYNLHGTIPSTMPQRLRLPFAVRRSLTTSFHPIHCSTINVWIWMGDDGCSVNWWNAGNLIVEVENHFGGARQ